MPIFNAPDFFTIRQLDLENKLYLPTSKLYSQVRFQLNDMYQDIHNVLIDAHNVVASSAKQVYEHPLETMTAWYEQAGNSSAALYDQIRETVLPVYQNWHVKIITGKEHTLQHLKAFWNDPEQTTRAALEPVTRTIASASELAEKNLQLFLDNPEQFMVSATAPVTTYLASLTESSKVVLLDAYDALTELFSLLASQPSATLQALYHNALSSLLDVYYDVISSFLVMA